MIVFEKYSDKLVLSYKPDGPSEWIFHEINNSGSVTISKTFSFSENELLTQYDPDDEYATVKFKVADKENDYYRFSKGLLSLEHDLYIHDSIKFERKLFVAERGISIFRKIGSLVEQEIYIGGDAENSIPITTYKELIAGFPNTYELNRYSEARISGIISSYLETKEDYESKYQRYLNKKVSRVGDDLKQQLSQLELFKYQSMLNKLKQMLDDEISYSEAQWQKELLGIILLLYPKYIHIFEEAPVRDTYSKTNRNIDYLMVDSSGNTDIIEIKKPFDQCVVTKRTYRDNYIPLRELSGTVMQVEKYIFYLNKWGIKGEEKLTEYYKSELPENFKIRITNPCGMIIMGRSEGLSLEQLQDFEVIKRKYKNIIDILTYDDLLERLEFMIAQWSGIVEQKT